MLAPVTTQPEVALAGATELTSPDGRWCARVRADSQLDGYHDTPVTALTITEVATGATVVDMILRQPELRLVRFLGPRRLLLVTDGPYYYDKDLAAGTQRASADLAELDGPYRP